MPGWGKMASFGEGQTLIHVTAVVTALLLLPEYQNATPEQRQKWLERRRARQQQ